MQTSHYKSILRLGVPIAIGQIGVIVMGFADTMMVGRYSTDSLAAASFVNNVFNLVTFLLMGYSYGLTPMVSALCGRGEMREAGSLLKPALTANAVFGLVLVGIMGVLYFFLDRLGQPAELLPLIRPYYIVILVSMLFVMVFNALRQFTDGTMNTSVGMWILLIGNALNIIGNYLLIYGPGPLPELGLLGAGLSTMLSRLFMAVAIGVVVATGRRYAVCREGWRKCRMKLGEVRHINSKSLPISLQMGMETGAFSFSAVMAGWLGAIPLAAYQVMVTVGTLGFLFYYSIGAATSIRVASFVGSTHWEEANRSTRAGMHILLIMAATASAVFLLFGEPLIRLFSTDGAVMAASLALIVPLVVYQFGDAMQICFANALRGTSQVMSMMWIAAVSYLGINIPLGFVLAFPCGLGARGLFYAFSAGLFTAAALFFLRYRAVMREAQKA